jgi:CspA family cold shock protein
MPKGTIRMLVKDRNFGFIHSQQGEDLFFHSNELRGATFDSLKEGQQVEFQIGRARNGRPQAVEISLTQTQSVPVPVSGGGSDEDEILSTSWTQPVAWTYLRALQTENEIRRLLTTYAYAVDSKDINLLMSIFTYDIRLIFLSKEYKGDEAVRGYYLGFFALQEKMRHKIFNVELDVKHSMGKAYVTYQGHSLETGTDSTLECNYRYKYARVNGKWQINELSIEYQI